MHHLKVLRLHARISELIGSSRMGMDEVGCSWRYLCVCTCIISERARAACLGKNLPLKSSEPIFELATFKRPCHPRDDSRDPPSPAPLCLSRLTLAVGGGRDCAGRKGTAADGYCDSEGTAGRREGCSPRLLVSSPWLRELGPQLWGPQPLGWEAGDRELPGCPLWRCLPRCAVNCGCGRCAVLANFQ